MTVAAIQITSRKKRNRRNRKLWKTTNSNSVNVACFSRPTTDSDRTPSGVNFFWPTSLSTLFCLRCGWTVHPRSAVPAHSGNNRCLADPTIISLIPLLMSILKVWFERRRVSRRSRYCQFRLHAALNLM